MTEPRGEVLWTPPPDVWERTAAGRPASAAAVPTPSLHAWSVGETGAFWAAATDFCGVRWRQPPAAMRRNRDAGRPLVPRRRAQLRRARPRRVGARRGGDVAVIAGQTRAPISLTWASHRRRCPCQRPQLRALGVEPGDRVVAYAPNIPRRSWRSSPRRQSKPSWSSCARSSACARSSTASPRSSRPCWWRSTATATAARTSTAAAVAEIAAACRRCVPSSACPTSARPSRRGPGLGRTPRRPQREPAFAALPADHPLYVLYSSGTTVTEAIVHSQGGIGRRTRSAALHQDIGRRPLLLVRRPVG